MRFSWFFNWWRSPPALEKKGKSITSLHNLSFCNVDTCLQIGCWGKSIFSDPGVNEGLSNFERLIIPSLISSIHFRNGAQRVLGGESCWFSSEVCPIRITQWLDKIDVIFVENWVPESMELSHTSVGSEGERVSSSVSLWVFSGKSASGVEWLMDITDIMNKESQVEAVPQVPWNLTSIWYWSGGFGVFQSWDKFSQFPCDVILVWIPICLSIALVEVWVVNKVPVGLIIPSFWLDIVSKGSTLNEGMIFFQGGELREVSKDAIGSCHDSSIVLHDFVIGNSGS